MNSKNITVKSQVRDTVSCVEHIDTPPTVATHAYFVCVCVHTESMESRCDNVQMEVEGEREKSKKMKEGVCVDDREPRTGV